MKDAAAEVDTGKKGRGEEGASRHEDSHERLHFRNVAPCPER